MLVNDFFNELKRRNVVRVGIAYGVVTWVLLQGIDVVGDILNFPDWVGQGLLIVLVVGFPVALFFSWAFEVTAKGVMKTADVDKSKSITHGTGQKINKLIIGGLVLAVAFLLVDKFFISNNGGEFRQAEAGQASIAVLPFVNMSEDKSNEYFAEGLSEELLNVLAKVPNLKVAGRTSSFQFKGQNPDFQTIGKTLNVDHILEGSVRKQGNRVRITAQLIRASDGFHMWSDTYDRNLEDIFAVQDEISAAIFDQLSVALGLQGQTPTRSAPTTDVAAYDRYLEARTLMARRGYENLLKAARLLEEATQIDPNYAEAWAVLSQIYNLIPYYGPDAIEVYLPRAEAAARRALDIDPNLSTAHAGLADAYRDQWRSVEAEAEYKKALALNPNEIEANSQYAQFLQRVGKTAESLPFAKKAYDLDPLSFVYAAVLANAYHGAGQHDLELEMMEKSLKLDRAGFAHLNGVALRLAHEDPERAIEILEGAVIFEGRQKPFPDDSSQLVILTGDRDAGAAFLRAALEKEKGVVEGRQTWFYWMWALYYKDYDLAYEVMSLELNNPDDFFDSQFFWIFRTPELMANDKIRKFIGEKTVYIDYWKANGFPPGCRAVGEEDFICE